MTGTARVTFTIALLLTDTLAAQNRGPLDLANAVVRQGAQRIAYGTDPLQFGELRLPRTKAPHPVAIVVHGGCWPGTFLDVAHAADFLRTVAREHSLDLTRVVALGHSAGGHLAMWLAARPKVPANSDLYVVNPLPRSVSSTWTARRI